MSQCTSNTIIKKEKKRYKENFICLGEEMYYFPVTLKQATENMKLGFYLTFLTEFSVASNKCTEKIR
jgi:hypothetical protein